MNDDSVGRNRLKRYRRPLLVAGPLLLLAIAGFLYFKNLNRVSTDDAYVVAARTDISANVSGRVVEVLVQDNQFVQAGEILFKLDERDFALNVADARARLASAKLQVSSLKASYRQHQAEVMAAKETLAYQENELDRQKRLVTQGVSSQAQLDQARHACIQAEQKLQGTQQELESVLAALNHHPDQDIDDHPAVRQAQAVLERALLDLSYTVVKAPQSGVVTKVEQLQVGDYVKGASPLFALVSRKNLWIEANFKETDLTHLHPGQPGTVEIDAFPGRILHGRVQSLSPGTGSSFSLLPPENATGNWVKVVQRLPVRISIENMDSDQPLQAGLSAVVVVDTRHDH
ncbi:HlyD family secretion protein [Ferrovum sp.]|uniref:HlyD family secretion protein n=1 Tax=Ferrovum sp. TaxID=2609467 RepID=UPI00260821D2|nr:HlyD family secretion protein [Ferrovum sp.]